MFIQSLHIYPIKSCRGIQVSSVKVMPWGFEDDHIFMLVSETGSHLSQREIPDLCLVQPLIIDNRIVVYNREGVFCEFPRLGIKDEKERKVTVHGQETVGFDQGDILARKFSDFLHVPCRLIRACPNRMRVRKVDNLEFTSPIPMWLAFQDSSPVHVITEDSLTMVEEMSGKSNTLVQFRPNIVLSGEDGIAHMEDACASMSVHGPKGSITKFVTRKKTERCSIPGINQETGKKEKELLKGLSSYRKGVGGKVFFGTYLIPFVFNRLHPINEDERVTVIV